MKNNNKGLAIPLQWDTIVKELIDVKVPEGYYKIKEKVHHPRPGWRMVWTEWGDQYIRGGALISGVLLTDKGHYEGEYYDKHLKILRLVQIPHELIND
tara:strand:+ start:84 stop:377 length:294 start_codon:yes stop_codon:yes gene_type:complete